jgi:hypothetical protein
VGFDGDAALAFEVHGIEDLFHHFALGECPGDFEQAVRECGFAVIDMRNDGEITDEFAIHAMWGSNCDYPTRRGEKEKGGRRLLAPVASHSDSGSLTAALKGPATARQDSQLTG